MNEILPIRNNTIAISVETTKKRNPPIQIGRLLNLYICAAAIRRIANRPWADKGQKAIPTGEAEGRASHFAVSLQGLIYENSLL